MMFEELMEKPRSREAKSEKQSKKENEQEKKPFNKNVHHKLAGLPKLIFREK